MNRSVRASCDHSLSPSRKRRSHNDHNHRVAKFRQSSRYRYSKYWERRSGSNSCDSHDDEDSQDRRTGHDRTDRHDSRVSQNRYKHQDQDARLDRENYHDSQDLRNGYLRQERHNNPDGQDLDKCEDHHDSPDHQSLHNGCDLKDRYAKRDNQDRCNHHDSQDHRKDYDRHKSQDCRSNHRDKLDQFKEPIEQQDKWNDRHGRNLYTWAQERKHYYPRCGSAKKQLSRACIIKRAQLKYGINLKSQNLRMEDQQKQLELQIQRRRERVEDWRVERARKNGQKDPHSPTYPNMQDQIVKRWSLENDSEDEIEIKEMAEDSKITLDGSPPSKQLKEEDDVDPLDKFMKGLHAEMRNNPKLEIKKTDDTATDRKKLVIVTGVAKPRQAMHKGELIEQNPDGLEYSSEEEVENLKETAVSIANKHKKELPVINHNQITYAPFRKNFYVEVPEIATMTQEEVDLYKEKLEGIRVKGRGCPNPIKTWAQCGVSIKELNVLRRLGYGKPTPIQSQAIPAIMSGRDLIGIAKTGSGKTLAFLLPMFRHILDQPRLLEMDGPIAIIMTPTRELCIQIGREIKRFTRVLNLHSVCVYGGTEIAEQIAELKRGTEVIVCTPGRMIDMLATNNGKVTNLRRITYLVLDEADRMFDMGFEPQVMRIIDNVRPDRQTIMFSATFPRQMEALARRILQRPLEIQVGGRSVVCKEIEQHVIILKEEEKFFKLLKLLGIYQEQGSAIVFVDKQENADILLRDLMRASYYCMSLHGGIDQFDRDSTIIDFKNGKIRILVATSVAARGLDVKHLILVVNYDCPNHYEDYVHRCGRTGRAGKKGFAYTFITPEQDRYSGDVVKAFELASIKVPEPLRKLWEAYKAKQEAVGKKVHTGGGFSGKGFKFDENEAAAVTERKMYQKVAHGFADSDDEELDQDIDQRIESLFATKRIVKEINAPPVPSVGIKSSPILDSTIADKLELAKKLAARINLVKSMTVNTKVATQKAAESILKGNCSQPLIMAKSVAEQIAANLNIKLNYQPNDEINQVDDSEKSFRKYEEELEINDFPQSARWRVTSREALAQISDYSEAGITIRGTHVPIGKSLSKGERKLYLVIESSNDHAVAKAKSEITRLIKEELLKLQNAGNHTINKTRYKVTL